MVRHSEVTRLVAIALKAIEDHIDDANAEEVLSTGLSLAHCMLQASKTTGVDMEVFRAPLETLYGLLPQDTRKRM